MKFLILTCYGSYIIEADDFLDATERAYKNSTGYDHVMAIVKMEETDGY